MNTLVAPNANREMAFFYLSPPAFIFYLLFPAFAIGAEGGGMAVVLYDALFLTDADFR